MWHMTACRYQAARARLSWTDVPRPSESPRSCAVTRRTPDTAVAVQVHQVAERHGIGVTASLKDAELIAGRCTWLEDAIENRSSREQLLNWKLP